MKFLITNDDGYNAIGIKKLASYAIQYGEVYVIAPKYQQSGKSHSLTMRRHFEIKQVEDILPGVKTWYVDSTPADCVRVAKYLLNLDIDVVLSGINDGYNIGDDILYSGTTAAATEAVLCGYKAIAFSTGMNDLNRIDENFGIVFDYIMKNKIFDKWCLFNVNIPVGAKEIAFAKQGRLHYNPEYCLDEDGLVDPKALVLWTRLDNDATDIDMIHNGYITITPLTVNRTNYEILDVFKK